MNQPVSARRAKIKEDQAKRQLFLAVIGTVILCVVFLVFVMPNLFAFVARLARRGGSPVSNQSGDTIPPQRPILTPIPKFSNQTNLEIVGFTEPKATVHLYVDNAEKNVTPANDDGQFTFTLTLEPGEHEIWMLAEDESGNISAESERSLITIDTTIPTLTISQPENGAVFTLPREKALTVKGTVSEKSQVRVNNSLVSTSETGEFQTTLQLANGQNEITITATDQAGNVSEEKKITVEYRP